MLVAGDDVIKEAIQILTDGNIDNSSKEMAIDLFRETQVKHNAVQDEINKTMKLGFKAGSKVIIPSVSDEVGVIIGFHKSGAGLSNGLKYPIVIKFSMGTLPFSTEQVKHA